VPGESGLQPTTRWLRAAGKGITLAQAMAVREMFRARVDAWFGDADLWVTPTVAKLAPRVGAWKDAAPPELFGEAAQYGAFTAVFNASGHPATSVPVWSAPGEHPLAVQLVAPRGHDVRALATARALLEALGTPVCPPGPHAR
jgi:amidase